MERGAKMKYIKEYHFKNGEIVEVESNLELADIIESIDEGILKSHIGEILNNKTYIINCKEIVYILIKELKENDKDGN